MHTSRAQSFKDTKSTKLSKAVDVLYRISETVTAQTSPAEFAKKLYRLTRQVIPCDLFSVASYDEESHELNSVFVVADGKPFPQTVELLQDGLLRDAILRKKVVVSSKDKQTTNSIRRISNKGHQQASRSIIASPVFFQGKIVGVVSVESYTSGAYAGADMRWMSILCAIIGSVFGKPEQHELSEDSVLTLTSRISHEMNQPLTGISGYCALIMEEVDKSSIIYNDLLEIEKQTQRLEQLIFDFQNVARSISPPDSKDNSE